MKSFILFAALAVAVISAAPQQQANHQNTRTSCTPGESWKDDCNTCTCMSNGVAACTLALCLHPSKRSVEDAGADDCVVGTWWMPDDCNTCRCTEAGKGAACTLIGCLPRTGPPPADRKECSEGAKWHMNGKACTCTADGKASCVSKTKRSDDNCTPGDTWKDDCNTCRCTPDGHKACSKMFCPPAPASEQLQPAQGAQ